MEKQACKPKPSGKGDGCTGSCAMGGFRALGDEVRITNIARNQTRRVVTERFKHAYDIPKITEGEL
jgi:hypothetical protein